MDAAARLFAERGFAGASIEEIAGAAGFSRGAFYSNFESKEELIAALLGRDLMESAADYARISAEAADAITALRAAGEWTAERAERGLRLFLEFLSHAARDPEFRSLLAGYLRGLRQATAQELERGAREYGIAMPVPPEELASLAMAIGYGLAIQRLIDPGAVPGELAPKLYSMVFSGTPGPGWKP